MNKEERQAYDRAWYHANKERLAANKKLAGKRFYNKMREIILAAKQAPCADCGQQFPPCVMDFDHRRGTKRFCISNQYWRGEKELIEEIAKCDVVCANCHRIRTHLGM